MYMRSCSKSKFHSHVRFSCSLTITSCSNAAVVIRRFALLYHPILPSQSMVISTQPGSARPVGSCQKFPWYGTRKNIMCENDPLFQHRYFLHNKFLVNDESLQIHESTNVARACCWEDYDRLRSNATFRFYIMSKVRLGFTHNVNQWIILNHAIVYDEPIDYCICGHVLLTFKV